MFRHKKNNQKPETRNQKPEELDKPSKKENGKTDISEKKEVNKNEQEENTEKISDSVKPIATLDGVRELLEKNLKWSQILYEQNRKVNRRLLWGAIASWLRLAIILIPLVIAIFYLLPFVQGFIEQYGNLLGFDIGGQSTSTTQDYQNILNSLNLSDGQMEQIKSILK